MEGSVLVKISESELAMLITSLRELNHPNEEVHEVAYKMLLKDLQRIKTQLDDKKADIMSTDEYYAEKVCEDCE